MSDPKATGVLSPWGLRKPAEPLSVAEQLRAKVRAGKSAVSVRGQRYSVLVVVPGTFKDPADTQKAGAHMLGEFLTEARAGLSPHLRRLKLSYLESDLLGPSMPLALGPLTLYAAVSSGNPDLALKMAVDRLATALTYYRHGDPKQAAVMQKYAVEIVRDA